MIEKEIKKAVESISLKEESELFLKEECKTVLSEKATSKTTPFKKKKSVRWVVAIAAIFGCFVLVLFSFYIQHQKQSSTIQKQLPKMASSISVLNFSKGELTSAVLCSDITELNLQNIPKLETKAFLLSIDTKNPVTIACPDNSVLIFDNESAFSNGTPQEAKKEYTLYGGEIIAWISEKPGTIQLLNANKTTVQEIISIQRKFWNQEKNVYYASVYPIKQQKESVFSGAYNRDFVFLDTALEYTVEEISLLEKNQIYDIKLHLKNTTEENLDFSSANMVLSDLSLLGKIEPTSISVAGENATHENMTLAPKEEKELEIQFRIPKKFNGPLYFAFDTKGTVSTKTETVHWITYFEI